MTIPTFNELAEEIHANAVRHGWWDTPKVDDAGASVPRNFGEVLMLICSEAAEAMDDWRDGLPLDVMYMDHKDGTRCEYRNRCGHQQGTSDEAKPVGVPSEMADIIIRTLDACAAYGIDIDEAIRAKMRYNTTRPYLHGRVR